MGSTKGYYPGQKNIPGLFQKIINNIPGHTVYYELFAGSAAVGKEISVRSMVAPKIHLNDIDKDVIDQLSVPAAIITNNDAIEMLQSRQISMASTDTFIFLDPPYEHSTRPNSTKLYAYELSESDHVRLLYSVLELKCQVMIIHPACILYDQMLSKWRSISVKVRYHNKTSIERIYMNYDFSGPLQITSYVGNDCWDRQRIKRKGNRLIEKIKKLPNHEQQYIIELFTSEFTNRKEVP